MVIYNHDFIIQTFTWITSYSNKEFGITVYIRALWLDVDPNLHPSPWQLLWVQKLHSRPFPDKVSYLKDWCTLDPRQDQTRNELAVEPSPHNIFWLSLWFFFIQFLPELSRKTDWNSWPMSCRPFEHNQHLLLTHCCDNNKPHNYHQIPIKLDVFSYSNYKHTNFIKVRMKHK